MSCSNELPVDATVTKDVPRVADDAIRQATTCLRVNEAWFRRAWSIGVATVFIADLSSGVVGDMESESLVCSSIGV
jgi:hypothetical protein